MTTWIVIVDCPHGRVDVAVQTNGSDYDAEKSEAEERAMKAVNQWNDNRWPEVRMQAAAFQLRFAENGCASMPPMR